MKYLCCVISLQGMSEYTDGKSGDFRTIDEQMKSEIVKNWATMGVAILTNYQALKGGFSWDGFVGPARDSGPFHFGVFLVYIALLVVAVMNLLTGMFVQPKAALDALCGVTCVTSVTMQGSMGTVSDTDSEVSTANAAPTGAYGRVGCDEMEYTGQVFRPDVRHCCRTRHL